MGIGPIKQEEVNRIYREEGDYETAKRMAVQNFLTSQLQYEDWEINGLEIMSTKMAKDNIVYIAVKEHDSIRELYTRKADCKNDDVTFRTYIPPQYYARFAALSKICKDRRTENTDLKTQIRIGLKDIELLTKLKSSEEPFKQVKLNEFLGEETIPNFDSSIKWIQQRDKPQRRRITSRSDRDAEPASGQNPDTEPASEHPLRRQRSAGMEDTTNKKSKTTALIVVDAVGDFDTPMGRMNISDIN